MSANPQRRSVDVHRAIAEYIRVERATRVTMAELCEHVLGLAPGAASRADEMACSAALRALGWERRREGGRASGRSWFYVPASTPAPSVAKSAGEIPAMPRLVLDALPERGYAPALHDASGLPELEALVSGTIGDCVDAPAPLRLVLQARGPDAPAAPVVVHNVAASSPEARTPSSATERWDGFGPRRSVEVLELDELLALAAAVASGHGLDAAHGPRAARTVGFLRASTPSAVADRVPELGRAAYVAALVRARIADGQVVTLAIALEGREVREGATRCARRLVVDELLDAGGLRLMAAEQWDGAAWRSLAPGGAHA